MAGNAICELLRGCLNEMDKTAAPSWDDIREHLAGRHDALRTMVSEGLPEGTFQGAEEVIELIPTQAWQDVQGEAWRGSETQSVEQMDSNFQGPSRGGSQPVRWVG